MNKITRVMFAVFVFNFSYGTIKVSSMWRDTPAPPYVIGNTISKIDENKKVGSVYNADSTYSLGLYNGEEWSADAIKYKKMSFIDSIGDGRAVAGVQNADENWNLALYDGKKWIVDTQKLWHTGGLTILGDGRAIIRAMIDKHNFATIIVYGDTFAKYEFHAWLNPSNFETYQDNFDLFHKDRMFNPSHILLGFTDNEIDVIGKNKAISFPVVLQPGERIVDEKVIKNTVGELVEKLYKVDSLDFKADMVSDDGEVYVYKRNLYVKGRKVDLDMYKVARMSINGATILMGTVEKYEKSTTNESGEVTTKTIKVSPGFEKVYDVVNRDYREFAYFDAKDGNIEGLSFNGERVFGSVKVNGVITACYWDKSGALHVLEMPRAGFSHATYGNGNNIVGKYFKLDETDIVFDDPMKPFVMINGVVETLSNGQNREVLFINKSGDLLFGVRRTFKIDSPVFWKKVGGVWIERAIEDCTGISGISEDGGIVYGSSDSGLGVWKLDGEGYVRVPLADQVKLFDLVRVLNVSEGGSSVYCASKDGWVYSVKI